MESASTYDFNSVVSFFSITGGIAEIKPVGSGHIHDTFHLVNTNPGAPDYLLQRVNDDVFKNVPGLMQNIRLVTDHLRKKLEEIPSSDPDKEVLTLISTKKGGSYYLDEKRNHWRMFRFLKNTRSYDLVTTAQQAYEGGRAFGKFLALLSNLDVGRLEETIPNFHDVESRFQQLQKAVDHDCRGRAKEVRTEIAFAKSRIGSMSVINKNGCRGILPSRVTHNDTKFNNVLLDENDHAQCVIDLDTVMPGYIAYDFGDAIRTTVNKAPEDESNIKNVAVDIDLFRSFTAGFMEQTSRFISDAEIDSLFQGALLMPYIMGLRFLTDYIAGDVYYNIHFPEQNKQRARAQFKLVEKMEEKADILQEIIRTTAKSVKKAN